MPILRFNSANPEIKLILEVSHFFGGLHCRLLYPDTESVALFVIASPPWLKSGLTADLKHHRGDVVVCRFTWTGQPDGFNFHLTRKDATTLLNYCKELNHV